MRITKPRTLIPFLAGLALLIGLMIGIGWLITHQLAHDWPFTAEDGVDRTLARDRTTLLNRVTGDFSTLGSTPFAIALTAVGAVIARLLFHRWRESFFLIGAVAVQALVFLLTTLAIARPRPTSVVHLDVSPPTSSFPSGHTAAAIALYGGVILLARRRGLGWPAWLIVLVPLAVGTSRLYRGMHHPSDVIAAMVLGALALLLVHRAVLREAFSGDHAVHREAVRESLHE